jgi:hypothetical protein
VINFANALLKKNIGRISDINEQKEALAQHVYCDPFYVKLVYVYIVWGWKCHSV